jgi:hypothetical protein
MTTARVWECEDGTVVVTLIDDGGRARTVSVDGRQFAHVGHRDEAEPDEAFYAEAARMMGIDYERPENETADQEEAFYRELCDLTGVQR